jgi:hypothetical protein
MALIPIAMASLYYFIGKSYSPNIEMLKQLFMSVCYSYLLVKVLIEIEDVLSIYHMDRNEFVTILRLVFFILNLDINMFEIRHLIKVARPT